MMLNFGTVTCSSAFIQLITLPMTPRFSASGPTRKPGWSWRKTSGTLNESHSTMKSVAFVQASAAVAPREARRDAAAVALLQFEEAVAVADRMDHLAHVVNLGTRLRDDRKDIPDGVVRSFGHRSDGRRHAVVRRQIREEALDRLD